MHRLLTLVTLILVVAMATASRAQTGNTLTIAFAGVPSGSCAFMMQAVDTTAGTNYFCNALTNAWYLAASGGTPVTPSGTLTLNHLALGAGTTVVKVDSACVTDGAGAISGCVSINAASISSGTAPTACGSATACFAGTEASTAGTPTAAQSYFRFGSTAHDIKFSLNNGAEGPLPINSGGTGAATLTANNVILGNGTSAVAFVAPSTSGNVLTSNGTTWTSAAAAAGGTSATAFISQTGGGGTGMTGVTQNHAILYSIYIPYDWTAYNVFYYVQTADNSTNTYDLGIYSCSDANGQYNSNATSATLKWHTGSTAGTTLFNATGFHRIAISGAPISGTKGWYVFAIGTNAAAPAAVLGGDSSTIYVLPYNYAASGSVAITYSGGLPSTVTCPTASFSTYGQLYWGIN